MNTGPRATVDGGDSPYLSPELVSLMLRPSPLRRCPTDPARIMFSVAFAEQSEYAAGPVSAAHDADAPPGELATMAARNLVYAMRCRDWAVAAERERGTDWATIAAALRCPEDALREQYAGDVAAWLAGADGAPEQPGAPGGRAMIGSGLPVRPAQRWVRRWLDRRIILAECPLPPLNEPPTGL